MGERVADVNVTGLMLNLLLKYALKSYAATPSLVANNALSIVTTASNPTTSSLTCGVLELSGTSCAGNSITSSGKAVVDDEWDFVSTIPTISRMVGVATVG